MGDQRAGHGERTQTVAGRDIRLYRHLADLYPVFIDSVRRKGNPLPEVRTSFENDCPAIGRVPDVLVAIERSGFLAHRAFHPAGRGLVGCFLRIDGDSHRGREPKIGER